ncbi:MAG: response regulator transcription factor [Planctomycetota bacterium]|jgi:DNA-binding NarL/FixJ family response regulator
MSPPFEAKRRTGENVSHGAADPVLVLLDDKQWSYLQRRYALTPRELQIADLVCRGLRNASIAKRLRIRPDTVKAHVRNIYRKVKVGSKITMLLRFVAEAREPSRVRSSSRSSRSRA